LATVVTPETTQNRVASWSNMQAWRAYGLMDDLRPSATDAARGDANAVVTMAKPANRSMSNSLR
jgi:hypothetical protein